MEKEKYTVITIVSDDTVIGVEELDSSEAASDRYKELKKFSEEMGYFDEEDSVKDNIPKMFVFLIKGRIEKQNKGDK